MDEARFDKQRRNVMVTSTLLIGAWLAKANFQDITIFGLTTHYPHRIEILWVAVIAYFMLRLAQLTGKEQLEDIQTLYQEMFIRSMIKIGKRKVYREYEEEVREEAKERGEQLVSSSVSVNTENYKYQGYVFDCKYNVGAQWKSEKGERHGATTRSARFTIGNSEFSRGRIQAVINVVLMRKVFTEYALPYLLGVTAIIVGFIGF